MRPVRGLRVLPGVVALGAAGMFGLVATGAGAASTHTVMTTTKTGKIAKLESMSSFSMKVGATTYVVKTNHMTHIDVDMKPAKMSALKVGETVTVKGEPGAMDTITATTITEGS